MLPFQFVGRCRTGKDAFQVRGGSTSDAGPVLGKSNACRCVGGLGWSRFCAFPSFCPVYDRTAVVLDAFRGLKPPYPRFPPKKVKYSRGTACETKTPGGDLVPQELPRVDQTTMFLCVVPSKAKSKARLSPARKYVGLSLTWNRWIFGDSCCCGLPATGIWHECFVAHGDAFRQADAQFPCRPTHELCRPAIAPLPPSTFPRASA